MLQRYALSSYALTCALLRIAASRSLRRRRRGGWARLASPPVAAVGVDPLGRRLVSARRESSICSFYFNGCPSISQEFLLFRRISFYSSAPRGAEVEKMTAALGSALHHKIDPRENKDGVVVISIIISSSSTTTTTTTTTMIIATIIKYSIIEQGRGAALDFSELHK